ncbi:MAG: CASTOR/POLLUX-related putative ion channel, partial [Anaerolineae bacterium]
FHIVAELRDVRNLDAARVVGKDEVEWVVVSDFVARVVAQTCHQSGLSAVYTELLDFSGDEIYFHDEPGFVGKTFGEMLSAFEKNAVMGLYSHDGVCKMNPSMKARIEVGDRIVVVAEDDDRIISDGPKGNIQVNERQITAVAAQQNVPEHLLILGWNRLGAKIIRELACYMPAGSEVTIVASVDSTQHDLPTICPERNRINLSIQHHQGETTDRRTLDGLNLPGYDHIVVLCYSDTLNDQKADAKTLITLLHLRDIADTQSLHYSIVSQMMDVRNRNLANITRADDFIVSDKLISLMMTQVAENKGLNAIFTDLFDPKGSEIYLKPISGYVCAGEPVNFYTVVEAARRRDEVAVGYRIKSQAQDAEQKYGVHLNPRKSEFVNFSADDRIIVLAES